MADYELIGLNEAAPDLRAPTSADTGVISNLKVTANLTATAGTANGVVYLNGSKVQTSGAGFQFDGTNLGLGVTPSAWASAYNAFEFGQRGSVYSHTSVSASFFGENVYNDGVDRYKVTGTAQKYQMGGGIHYWYTAPSGTAGAAISFTQAMALDASGNWLLGTTTGLAGISVKVSVDSTENGIGSKVAAASSEPFIAWNAATTGDNVFIGFGTEGGYTPRGSISYNRGGGLVAYNTTSDYRAKDIFGEYLTSGEIIDQLTVHLGKMKGSTLTRPMFVAHEAQAIVPYSVTGVKDAVDAANNPIYQQMDHSSLVPVLWAEVKQLRQRIAVLEAT